MSNLHKYNAVNGAYLTKDLNNNQNGSFFC